MFEITPKQRGCIAVRLVAYWLECSGLQPSSSEVRRLASSYAKNIRRKGIRTKELAEFANGFLRGVIDRYHPTDHQREIALLLVGIYLRQGRFTVSTTSRERVKRLAYAIGYGSGPMVEFFRLAAVDCANHHFGQEGRKNRGG